MKKRYSKKENFILWYFKNSLNDINFICSTQKKGVLSTPDGVVWVKLWVIYVPWQLFSFALPLHSGVQMCTGRFNAEGQFCNVLTSHPIQGGIRTTPNHFILQKPERSPGLIIGPLGSYADLTCATGSSIDSFTCSLFDRV